MIATAAFCCFIASVPDKESKALILGLLLIGGMLIIGLVLHKKFSVLQYNGWIFMGNTQEYIQSENGLYVGGIGRIILEICICLIPGSQSIFLVNMDAEHIVYMILGSIFTTVLCCIVGVQLFEKKELN